MEALEPDESALERVPTGVPGLDTVLHGGLLRGGSYLLQGVSGAGKTVLANQISFHHARAGGKVAYFTLLAEDVGRLLLNLSSLEFFDRSLVGGPIHYLGAFQEVQSGRKKLLQHLLATLRQHAASFAVIDGLSAAVEQFEPREWRLFLHELQAGAELLGCTSLYLLPAAPGDLRAEHTVVDGILNLHMPVSGSRTERQLEVRKSRGSDSIGGRHFFDISLRGIRVYPRLESLERPNSPAPRGRGQLATGIPDLDEMLSGGLADGSTTLLLGAAGTGKTTLGLRFLTHGAERGEAGLHFGFYESPDRLIDKAESLGWPLRRQVENGDVEIAWQLPTEALLDALGEELLERVDRGNVTRCFIDGLSALEQTASHPERVTPFLTALMNALRVRGVTTLATAETPSLIGGGLHVPVDGVSPIVENLVLLRHVEHRGRLRKLLSIFKTRDQGHDRRLRELRIGEEGLVIVDGFEDADALLTGIAQSPQRKPAE